MSLHELRRKLNQKRLGPITSQPNTKSATSASPQQLDLPECSEGEVKNPPAVETKVLSMLSNLEAQGFAHVSFLKEMDPYQLSCVLCPDSAIVTAPVGSGKTTVLIQKIVHLLAQGVAAEHILVFTFTRKAAREIRQRLKGVCLGLGWSKDKQPRIGTFHSLAYDLISKSRRNVETPAKLPLPSILDALGQLDLLNNLIERMDLDILYRKKLIRRVENYRLGQKRFGSMKRDDDFGALMSAYGEEKVKRNFLDYDDLVAKGTQIARELAETTRPSWILVDELQDTDRGQMALIESWRKPDTQLFAVGDPDQMIYSWRGTQRGVFSAFQESWETETFTLTSNYRSAVKILEGARFVLSLGRLGGPLIPARTQTGVLSVEGFHDVVAETCFLASALKSGAGERTQAILVRTRNQIEPLRQQLSLAGIDVVVRESGMMNLNLRTFCLGYFRWLLSPDQCPRNLRWVVDGDFGFSKLRGKPVAELLDSEDFSSYLKSQDSLDSLDVTGILCRLDEIRDAWKGERVDAGVETWIDSSGVLSFLRPLSSDAPIFVARLRSWLDDLSVQSNLKTVTQWAEAAVDHLSSMVHEEVEEPSTGSVEIMTMHASKGLEYDHVFISGVNAGLVPLKSSDRDGDSQAEERRLLFVAMTRAKDRLFMTWHKNPAHPQARPEPSPFLDLIPQDLMDEPSIPQDTPQMSHTWGAGLMVRHARYGEGVVVSSSDEQVCCEFEKFGAKIFPTGMCPLIRL